MSRSDRLLKAASLLFTVLCSTIVLLVVGFLIREATPAIRELGVTRFFTDDSWHPLSSEFNLTPMIVATFVTSVGAMLIAFPLGIGSALFSSLYAPAGLSSIYRRLIEVLAGIPSVVIGLWGLVVLAPIIAKMGGSGQNLLTATIVLGLMTLPTIALLSESAIRAVPREWIQGASALGMRRSGIVLKVILPSARRGIGGAVLLSLTRALGETMAVLMVAGNIVEFPLSLLAPGRTLNANIALELGYASAAHRSVLFVSGLVLMLVVSFIVVGSYRFSSAYLENRPHG